MSLKWRCPDIALGEIDFSKVFFWVQLQVLPLENTNDKSAKKILNHVGDVAEVENPIVDGRIIRLFTRAMVLVDVRLPLYTGCRVRDRPRIWVSLKYEKLHDLCFKCGVIGDEQKDCKKEKVMSLMNKDVSRYGPKVGVPLARSLREILEEQGRWRKKCNQGRRRAKS